MESRVVASPATHTQGRSSSTGLVCDVIHSAGLLNVVVARIDGNASTAEVALGATGGAESVDGVGIVRNAGVMAVVERGGEVLPGMPIDVALPDGAQHPLAPV